MNEFDAPAVRAPRRHGARRTLRLKAATGLAGAAALFGGGMAVGGSLARDGGADGPHPRETVSPSPACEYGTATRCPAPGGS